MSRAWHLISGEYPPLGGGIGDYSRLLARSLADLGREVHVWTTGTDSEESRAGGPIVHRIGEWWSAWGLARLSRGLDAFEAPRRLLVQYAPNSFGYKGMNLGFARWLLDRKRRGDRIDAMFHEVWYIPGPFDTRAVRRLLPLVQKPMARRILEASYRVFVSTPRWADLLESIEPTSRRPITWLPVPSTIPVVDNTPGVLEIRQRVSPEGSAIVGHFGTFSNAVGGLLAEILPEILGKDPSRVGLLIGRNGREFAGRMVAEHPTLVGRVVATGGLDPVEVSKHLAACDLLVQPYPDGVCGRRTTFMAGLAHGVATVATVGGFTPDGWKESGRMALAAAGDRGGFVRIASGLLDDPAGRIEIGRLGRELYERDFAIEVTVRTLLDGSEWSRPGEGGGRPGRD